MAESFVLHIADILNRHRPGVLLLEDQDDFLNREDVASELKQHGIEIHAGSTIAQRVRYELREPDTLLVLLCKDKSQYLEDMQQEATERFQLKTYFSGLHIPSLRTCELPVLEWLFRHQDIYTHNRRETLKRIEQARQAIKAETTAFNFEQFSGRLERELGKQPINWFVVARIISRAIVESVKTPQFEIVMQRINHANSLFQKALEQSYETSKKSSAVKKPTIVSKVLDHISFSHREKKIALIVIDGMAFWQYEMIRQHIPQLKHEEAMYSWIPSITQLSRQALFKGKQPEPSYSQNPVSEKKLWFAYWEEKGIPAYAISYQHDVSKLENLSSVSKLGLVFTELDQKMHGCSNYQDLYELTQNWIQYSPAINMIQQLIDQRFHLFLTTDHGNMQARGWRGLKGREKLGSNSSGSRSQRHIEYSDERMADDFLEQNPELTSSIVRHNSSLYFKSDLSFSTKPQIVTHGGAHILEVLIPFIEIEHEKRQY